MEKIPPPVSLVEKVLAENIKLIKEYCVDEDKVRLNESDFADIYSTTEIRNDLATVARLKDKMQKEDYHLGQEGVKTHKEKSGALEAIIAIEGNDWGWFGEGVSITLASEYDDLVNRVDEIIEIPSPAADDQDHPQVQRVALAVDASMNAHISAVIHKMESHLSHIIGRSEPLEVKYFKSDIDGHKGKLKMVIPVVVGVSGERVPELINAFANLIKLGEKPASDEKSKALYQVKLKKITEHPAQKIFLEEIKLQLDFYLSKLADREDKNSNFYRLEITNLQKWIEEVLDQKQEIAVGDWGQDKMYLTIKAFTEGKL